MREPQNPDWLYHTDIGTGPESPAITLTIRDIEEVECGGKTRVGLRFRYRRNAMLGDLADVRDAVEAAGAERDEPGDDGRAVRP